MSTVMSSLLCQWFMSFSFLVNPAKICCIFKNTTSLLFFTISLLSPGFLIIFSFSCVRVGSLSFSISSRQKGRLIIWACPVSPSGLTGVTVWQFQLCNVMIWYLYLLWNDSGGQSSQHTPSHVASAVFLLRAFKTHSPGSFQVGSTLCRPSLRGARQLYGSFVHDSRVRPDVFCSFDAPPPLPQATSNHKLSFSLCCF